jgi:alpha-L-glutamate ligase-like protein
VSRRRWLLPWKRARRVLGLNARNLLYVHGLNRRRHFPIADDKVRTKRTLGAAGVPTPETIAVLATLSEVTHARPMLEASGSFVVKPAHGRQGGGIIVVAGREGDAFLTAGGKRMGWDDLRRCMGDILFGVHSVGQSDVVLIEQRVQAHPALGLLAEYGLPDIRVILLHGQPAMAMMRVATRASGGRANLHQGALGVGVRLGDGYAFRCIRKRSPVDAHPDNGAVVSGFHVPLWEGVLDVARHAAACVPLPYLGVDIVLDAERGPLVMEVNARPGLEIQNVNGRGLRRRLHRLGGPGGATAERGVRP